MKREVQRKRRDERLRQAYLHKIDPAYVKLVTTTTTVKSTSSKDKDINKEEGKKGNMFNSTIALPETVVHCARQWLRQTACVRYWRRYIFEAHATSVTDKDTSEHEP